MMESAGLAAATKDAEEMSRDEVAKLPRAELTAFAPHPLNPAHRHESEEELEGLAASISGTGVLSPPIVATRKAVVDSDREIAHLIAPSVRFIILDGHRRWGASKLAGQADLPYLLRDDLADPSKTAEIFLASNIHPEQLRPLEEARGYERAMKYRGVKQVELAAIVGVSQGRISKSVQLLKLPTIVQEAVDAQVLSPHAARDLLKVSEPYRESVYREAWSSLSDADRAEQDKVAAAVRSAISRAAAEADQRKAVAEAESRLRAEAVPVIVPDDTFGADQWRHELRGDEEVEIVRAEGSIAGAVIHGTGRITYYSTNYAPRHRPVPVDDPSPADSGEYSNGIAPENTVRNDPQPPTPSSNGATPPDPDAAKKAAAAAEAKRLLVESQESHKDRLAACRRLIAKFEQATLLDVLADGILALRWVNTAEGLFMAKHLGVDSSEDSLEELMSGGSRPEGHRTALTIALATLESEASRSTYTNINRPWPLVIRRHVQRLADLGHHQLTDYDTARIENGAAQK